MGWRSGAPDDPTPPNNVIGKAKEGADRSLKTETQDGLHGSVHRQAFCPETDLRDPQDRNTELLLVSKCVSHI